MNSELLQRQIHNGLKVKCRYFIVSLLLIFTTITLKSQVDSIPCLIPWIPETYNVEETHTEEGESFWQNGGLVPANVVNESETDYARAHIKIPGSASIRVSAGDDVIHDGGVFAGFKVKSNTFPGSEYEAVTVSTYLDGILQETYTGADLEGTPDPEDDWIVVIGFTTTLSFNEVEISFEALAQPQEHFDVFYAVIGDLCPAECIIPWMPLSFDVGEIHSDEGESFWQNGGHVPGNVVNHSLSDYARAHINFGGSAMIRVFENDSNIVYDAGLFAGFKVKSNTFPGSDYEAVTVTTYLNGEMQEVFTGPDLEATPDSTNDWIVIIGFTTTLDFNQVEISFEGISQQQEHFDVYYAVLGNCPNEPPIETECPTVEVTVLLEGPYDVGTETMRNSLNQYHLLPGQNPDLSLYPGAQLFGIAAPHGQPYDSIPWNWPGREGDNYGDAPGNIPYDPEVIDWLLISVRAVDSLPENEVWKCAGLLYNNGSVIFPEDCECADPLLIGVKYYIVVEHRNHLPVMSTPVYLTDFQLVYDFSENQSWIYDHPVAGPLGYGQKTAGGKYVMYAANSEQTSARVDINSSDDNRWLIDNGDIFQYRPGDHNMDGDVNATDEFVWLNNNSFFTLMPF